jgi:ferric-dicitrate binding protein FerR (iron transport regulator)
MSRNIGLVHIALALAASAIAGTDAVAQSASSCSLQPVVGTARQTLHCGDGISITTERGARFQLLDRNGDGQVDGASLSGKAMLLDIDSARVKSGFQVITPQAIAAVRGTRWAVDVQSGKTSVLVLRGRVAVRRDDQRRGVVLGVGQGVDVQAGTSTPLAVKRWPAPRVNALIARLGR